MMQNGLQHNALHFSWGTTCYYSWADCWSGRLAAGRQRGENELLFAFKLKLMRLSLPHVSA